MRPLVSYDDIATPIQENPPLNGGPASPPKKRRRTNYRAGQKRGGHRTQSREEDHDDEGEASPKKARKSYGLQEESRQLTHEEVWDDSALIRAWDAAVEEYEVR
jgi:Survival Motor Neuron, Gemin2-binding domain